MKWNTINKQIKAKGQTIIYANKDLRDSMFMFTTQMFAIVRDPFSSCVFLGSSGAETKCRDYFLKFLSGVK